MNLFNLMAVLSLDSSNFESGMNKSESSVGKLVKTIKNAAITKSVLDIGKASLKAGMNFEASMSQVAATMGITTDEIKAGSSSFEMLEEAAKEAGKTTQFSASESAEALNYLALAGYDAETAVKTLPTVLNLAAAGGMGLAEASDMVTDSMSALGLETTYSSTFVDQLAKTSQKSNTSVSQLGQAILTVGGTAKGLAGGTVELNTQLGILADRGIKGAEGGTALRNIILSLSSPTDKAAARMKQLGLEVHDANGNMRSTNDIFKDLNAKLSEMSEKERTQVLSDLFNKVDLKSANALLAGSGERFEELSKQIEASQGAADEMAKTLNDNLAGALKGLNSAFESVGIAIYQKFDSPLKNVVNTITMFVRELGTIIEESKNLSDFIPNLMKLITKGITQIIVLFITNIPNFIALGFELIYAIIKGIVLSIPVLVVEFVKAIPAMIAGFVKALPNMIIQGTKLILALIAGLVIGIPLLVEMAPHLINMFVKSTLNRLNMLVSVGNLIIPALISGIISALPWLAENAIQMVDLIANTISSKLPSILEKGANILSAVVDGIVAALPILLDTAIIMIEKFLNIITENLPTILEYGVIILNKLVEGILNSLPKIIESAIKIITLLAKTILENLPLILQKGAEIITNLVTGIKNNLPKIRESITEGIKLFLKTIIEKLPDIIKAGIDIIVKLTQGIIEALPTLISEGAKLMLDLAQTMINSLPSFLSIGKDIVKGVWNGITSMAGWIGDKISGFFSGLVDKAKNALGIHSPSRVMRDEVGKWIPAGVDVGIEKEMPELRRTLETELNALADVSLRAPSVNFDSSSSSLPSNKEVTININNPRLTAEEQARELRNTEMKMMLGYI